jgi:hypothetical protein
MEAALFYSNRCNKCNELKKFKSYGGITKICVDDKNVRRKLPKYITSVPCVMINHKGNQKELKFKNDVVKWFELIDSSGLSVRSIGTNKEPPPHNMPSNNTQQQQKQNQEQQNNNGVIGSLCSGDMFSSGYSSLDSGLNDIGNNYNPGNFSSLNDSNEPVNNVSDDKVENDFDKHMNEMKLEREKLF